MRDKSICQPKQLRRERNIEVLRDAVAMSPSSWCKVVQTDDSGGIMKATQSADGEKAAHRLSVSLTAEQHHHLARIAQQHRVSIAWVVREAIERLLTEPAPLFRAQKRLP